VTCSAAFEKRFLFFDKIDAHHRQVEIRGGGIKKIYISFLPPVNDDNDDDDDDDGRQKKYGRAMFYH